MDALSDMKFGVGQPVSRKEDPVLLRGQGRYTDDINLPGQAYAVMVRSKIAHGLLKGIDAAAAALEAWNRVDEVFGLGTARSDEVPAEVLTLVEQRQAARKARA